MAVVVGPTVRQRQLGMRLRAIRTDLGLSVEAVAKELECSPSKISRLETASRRPNPRDVRDLCKVYKLDDATLDELVGLAREAKEPGWWRQYADVGLDPYIGLEQDASAITSFAAFYVPALLQTGDYAKAIIQGIAPRMDPGILKERVEVRLRRQQLLDRDSPPRYRVLIDEAVLHRPTGGPDVMVAQIDRILERIEEGKVIAQIVPFDAGAIASQDSNFVLLEFGDSVLSSVVFVESLLNNQILEKQADVERYREALEHLRDSALTPRESKNRMTQLRKSYETTGRLRYRRSPGRPYLRKDTYGDVPIGLRQSRLALVARLRRRRVHHGGARQR
jgi:transcriptional regulator with XRE-family HTH domain